MVALKTVIVLFAVIAATNAECCTRPSDGYCPNGSLCLIIDGCFCCANGWCNIFCCNCDGGCRQDTHGKGGKGAAALERFRAINTDKDGGISFNEFKDYSGMLPYNRIIQALFSAQDLNKDGKISVEEFDEDAAKHIKSEL